MRILTLLFVLLAFFPSAVAAETPVIPAELTADELVARMRAGWNLGNTFDAWDEPGARLRGDVYFIETLWLGGPNFQTTQTLIQAVRRAGFDTLRVPVTWQKVADPADNWRIREDWLERVRTVVDWALEEDMFVILNAHHENQSLYLDIEGAGQSAHPGNLFITNIWRQIAEAFADYDERLIFAGMNEPRHEGGYNEWWGGSQIVRDNVNELNQAFVDTVRATGGNNVHRILQVPTVAAGATPNGMRDFLVPKDPLNPGVNKIIWSIHTYSPFAWAHDGIGAYLGPASITDDLRSVARHAERLGLPVVLGEWGSIHASVGEGADQELRNSQRPQHAEDYVRAAAELGMPTIWWDNGGFRGSAHTFGIIRRNYPHDISDPHQAIINGIMRGAGAYDYIREVYVPELYPYEAEIAEETRELTGENIEGADESYDETVFEYENGNEANGFAAWTLILIIGGGAVVAVLFKKRK